MDAATPSISPMVAVPTPSTFDRKSGSTFWIISLEMSVRKLVALSTQTLRERPFAFGSAVGMSVPVRGEVTQPTVPPQGPSGPVLGLARPGSRTDASRMFDDSTLIEEILASAPVSIDEGDEIGRSREGRKVRGFIFGEGPIRVSLIAGCHSDEPVGPALLRRLARYLMDSGSHPLLERCEWWIVPHANPDGEVVNHTWEEGLAGSVAGATGAAYDPVAFLTDVMRELPGEDMEFCFPKDADDREARPENLGIYDWWRSGGVPFDVHASLHGMAMSAGPFFLLDAAWADRCAPLKARCAAEAGRLGYTLHDVERHGEKGFHRLERGFGTRPDSEAMRKHFLALGDEATAGRFRPSSMEAMRSFGADCLTVVSEMPLFITPGVGETLGPPDPVREAWLERRNRWVSVLRSGADEGVASIEVEIATSGLRPMPIRDQMVLQWTLVAAAIDLASAHG